MDELVPLVRDEYNQLLPHLLDIAPEVKIIGFLDSLSDKQVEKLKAAGIDVSGEIIKSKLTNWLLKGFPKERTISLLISEHRSIVEHRSSYNYFGCREKIVQAGASLIAAFVKRECNRKELTKARGIQGYAELTVQAFLGPRITALQKAWGKILIDRKVVIGNKTYALTMASGMNGDQLGDWITGKRNLYDWWYERDGKNWDATMDEEDYRCKFHLYEQILDPESIELLKAGRVVEGMNTVKHKGGMIRVNYKLNNTTKSGHNDTTLSNTLVNLMKTVDAMHSIGVDGCVIAMGDDMLAGVNGEYCPDELASQESTYNMVPEYRGFRGSDSWMNVSFVSGIWAPSGDQCVFIPKPGRQLSGLLWTHRMVTIKNCDEHAAGVVAGLPGCYWRLPVISQFFAPYRRNHATVDVEWEKKLQFQSTRMIDEGWFELRYRTNPDEIEKCISMIPKNKSPYSIFKHELTERITNIDLEDAPSRETFGDCY